MGAGRLPSRSNTSQPGQDNRADYFGLDKFAEASRERESAAASRERANRMNSSQPGLMEYLENDLGQINREKFSSDRFGTLLRDLGKKESINRRKVRGMLM